MRTRVIITVISVFFFFIQNANGQVEYPCAPDLDGGGHATGQHVVFPNVNDMFSLNFYVYYSACGDITSNQFYSLLEDEVHLNTFTYTSSGPNCVGKTYVFTIIFDVEVLDNCPPNILCGYTVYRYNFNITYIEGSSTYTSTYTVSEL